MEILLNGLSGKINKATLSETWHSPSTTSIHRRGDRNDNVGRSLLALLPEFEVNFSVRRAVRNQVDSLSLVVVVFEVGGLVGVEKGAVDTGTTPKSALIAPRACIYSPRDLYEGLLVGRALETRNHGLGGGNIVRISSVDDNLWTDVSQSTP